MQGGRDPFFGFGDPFGSFGGQRSLISSFFGGNDPFDDPFFTRPFGSIFESNFFGFNGGPFMNPLSSGFLEHQPTRLNSSRGPVIEELNSDEEAVEKESRKDKKENPRKHGRSGKEPFVQDPDDEATEKKSKHMARPNEIYQMQNARSQPQTHSFTFQSTTVSYGGANGAYYTSSSTRRSGSDGLTFEEIKEADSSTRQATHRVSRGIHDKGHSITRKLNSDGHVDTMQTLHNLDEDELTGFEEAWKGNARKYLPGLGEGFANQDSTGSGSINQHRLSRGGWALPSTERSNNQESSKPDIRAMAAPSRHSARAKTDSSGPSRISSKGNGSSKKGNNKL
ncbi:glycine-rich family protein [Striga asiatica]|uniref:Glycine-rich family protein n=1 Tax=Striga asiatica TaxID=4170 RepID=A0A5A7PCN8_STRAF|nr:glycine-rich family protein [Striga asiatica]